MQATALDYGNDSWKCSIDDYARIASGGEWFPYHYLERLATKIRDTILTGGGRLIIGMPPQNGKSQLISRWTTTWFLDTFPDRWVLNTSYEASKAVRWGRVVRNYFMTASNPWTRVLPGHAAANNWGTTAGGGMVCAGVNGPLAGEPGDLLLIDDPYKNWLQAHSRAYEKSLFGGGDAEEAGWFDSTFYTRQRPGATIILIMHRWSKHDLAAWLLKDHSDNWEFVACPAIATKNDWLGRPLGTPLCPQRYPLDVLKKIKAGVSPLVWAGLFQQDPVAEGGTVIQRDWLKQYWDVLPPYFDEILCSWDMAFKNKATSSFVCGQVWGRYAGKFFLIGQVHARMSYTQTRAATVQLASDYEHIGAHRKVLIEDKANGPAIMDDLSEVLPGLIPFSPEKYGSKEARLHATSPIFQAKNVIIPNPKIYPWVSAWIDDMTAAPNAEYMDKVDTTTQALIELSKTTGVVVVPKIEGLTRTSPWRS